MSRSEGANTQTIITVEQPNLDAFNAHLSQVRAGYLDLQTREHEPMRVAVYRSELSNVLETRGHELNHDIYRALWLESQGIRLLLNVLTAEEAEAVRATLRNTEAGFYAAIKTQNMAEPMNEYSNVLGGVMGFLAENHPSYDVVSAHKTAVDERIEAYKAGTGEQIEPGQMRQRTVTRRYAD